MPGVKIEACKKERDVKKRAIILIPGLKRQERYRALRYFIEGITHRAESYKVTKIDAEAIQPPVYEAFWSDTAPDRSAENIWTRTKASNSYQD